MKMWVALGVAAILASLVAGLICLPRLPDPMAVHWGFSDQPDDFMPKVPAVVLIPLLSLLLLVVLVAYWGMAALVKNPVHRRALGLAAVGAVVPLLFLLAYVQGIVLIWNLGVHVPVGQSVLAGVAVAVVAVLAAQVPLMRVELAASRAAGKFLPPGVWFPAKRYGWGWGMPCTWQGWVAAAVWLVVLLGVEWALLLGLRGDLRVALSILYPLVMVALLVGLCYWKGERPSWRWGEGE